MSVTIKEHKLPKPKYPHIEVDIELDSKLNNHELLKCLNKSFFMIVMGRPGSGKSSHIYVMLTNVKMFAGVFERVYVIMPTSSKDSFGEDSRLHELPEDRFYEELTSETIDEIEQKIDENREKGWKSLLILDDVQNALKGPAHLRLLHLAANRRHKMLSIILAAQTYKRIPLAVRQIASDLFCFNLSKENMKQIFEELIEIDKDVWERFLLVYKNIVQERNKAFLYINLTNQVVFVDWDQQLQDSSPPEFQIIKT